MGQVLKAISLSFKSCLTYTTHPAENYRRNTWLQKLLWQYVKNVVAQLAQDTRLWLTNWEVYKRNWKQANCCTRSSREHQILSTKNSEMNVLCYTYNVPAILWDRITQQHVQSQLWETA